MALVKFLAGTLAAYNTLATKDANSLYFITDSNPALLYKGDKLYTKSWLAVESLPETGIAGVLYLNAADNAMYTWNGSAFVAVSRPVATVVEDGNINPVTSGAVYTAIQNAIKDLTGGSVLVKNVTASETSGKVKVETGSGSEEFAIKGVIVDPTYDADTRTITLPYADGTDSLVINLGKDMVVTSGSYNAADKEIELVLTSGDVINIPVASLIDIYTGAASNSIEVSVSDGNVITANVKVAVASEGEHNDLEVRADGLFVDVQSRVATAKKEAIDAAAADATSKANAAEAAAKKHTDDKLGAIESGKTVADLISENATAAANAQKAAETAQSAADEAGRKAGQAQSEVDLLETAFAEYKTTNDAAVKKAQDTADSKATMAEVEAKDYATKAEAQGYANAKDTAIQAAQNAANAAQGSADANTTAIATLNGNAETLGSVAHSVAAGVTEAKGYTDAALTWGTF